MEAAGTCLASAEGFLIFSTTENTTMNLHAQKTPDGPETLSHSARKSAALKREESALEAPSAKVSRTR